MYKNIACLCKWFFHTVILHFSFHCKENCEEGLNRMWPWSNSHHDWQQVIMGNWSYYFFNKTSRLVFPIYNRSIHSWLFSTTKLIILHYPEFNQDLFFDEAGHCTAQGQWPKMIKLTCILFADADRTVLKDRRLQLRVALLQIGIPP